MQSFDTHTFAYPGEVRERCSSVSDSAVYVYDDICYDTDVNASYTIESNRQKKQSMYQQIQAMINQINPFTIGSIFLVSFFASIFFVITCLVLMLCGIIFKVPIIIVPAFSSLVILIASYVVKENHPAKENINNFIKRFFAPRRL